MENRRYIIIICGSLLLLISNSISQTLDTTFYKSGKIKSIDSYDKKGNYFGDSKSFYENGQLSQIITYNKNEKAHGLREEFYENSQQAIKIKYNNGNYVYSHSWFPNKQKQREEYYKNGLSHGWSVEWDSTGRCIDSTRYEEGFVLESIRYFVNSTQIQLKVLGVPYSKEKRNSIMTEDYPPGGYIGVHTFAGFSDVVMADLYSPKGKLIAQIRNGKALGPLHWYSPNTKKYDGELTRGHEVWDNPKAFKPEKIKIDPNYQPPEIPKNKHLPWDVKKYGYLK